MMGNEWTDIEWLGMGIGMVAWVLVLAVIIGLVVWLMNRTTQNRANRRGDSPEDALRSRFANGEIDDAEFEHRLALLRR